MKKQDIRKGDIFNCYRLPIHVFGQEEYPVFKKQISNVIYDENGKVDYVKIKGSTLEFNISTWENNEIATFYNSKVEWYISYDNAKFVDNKGRKIR